MKRVFKDSPISEVTLRKFEKPSSGDVRNNVRKFCISIGLLQPGDSRDIISDLLFLLVNASKRQEFMSIEKINNELSKKDGGTPSNVRRHLRRLKNLNLVEKTVYGYRIKEFLPLRELFDKMVLNFTINPILERVQDYCNIIDDAGHQKV